MISERHQRPPPRERTFGEVFPWRNIRRAVMLVLLIVAIVMIKRSTGPLLTRAGEMWSAPSAVPPTSTPAARSGEREGAGVKIRLGPGLAPGTHRGELGSR